MSREPILTARGLIKRYGKVTALDSADFDLYPGEILAVIGDNGAGKSSLIKALSGAVTPDEGEIRLDGQPVRFRSPIEARKAGIENRLPEPRAVAGAVDRRQHVPRPRDPQAGPLGSLFRMLDRKAMEKVARDKLSELGLLTIQNINQRWKRCRAASARAWPWPAPRPSARR